MYTEEIKRAFRDLPMEWKQVVIEAHLHFIPGGDLEASQVLYKVFREANPIIIIGMEKKKIYCRVDAGSVDRVRAAIDNKKTEIKNS